MSHKLIDHNKDLKRLRDNGYEVHIKTPYLLVSGIPYVNSEKEVETGIIVSELTLAGDKTAKPKTHVVYFIGDQPCNKDGSEIKALLHGKRKKALTSDIEIDRSFSNKPKEGYSDYYHKITSYVNIITGPAQALDGNATPQTYRLVDSQESDSPFTYPDTNSSRSEISSISEKLKHQKIGIIGLGGTGSYLLDFISKTPVKEIHLFDGDNFLVHNAFRAPGAPSIKALNKPKKKVSYFKSLYSKMHKGIITHTEMVTSSNIDKLKILDFVFICIDNGTAKKIIVDYLKKMNTSFIDSGMGIEVTDQASLIGVLRVTTAIEGDVDHIFNNSRISFSIADEEDAYNQNIQIAELNALNAIFAVIKWKKISGFYHQYENEKHSLYMIDDNSVINEDFET